MWNALVAGMFLSRILRMMNDQITFGDNSETSFNHDLSSRAIILEMHEL